MAAAVMTATLAGCKAFDFFGSPSDAAETSSAGSMTEGDASSAEESASAVTQTTTEEITIKQTTTAAGKAGADSVTPETTTATSAKTAKAIASATNKKATNGTTQAATTKGKNAATTTTAKDAPAQNTDFGISVNLPLSFNSSKTASSIYYKWRNSDINAQGSLFGTDYLLIKDSYGGMSLKCSNSNYNNTITAITSNSSIVSITEIKNTPDYTGITLKANGTGKATITASIPNNTKTFSFTVAVVTEDQVISTYEKEAMRIINQYRAEAGVSALSIDAGLKSTAQIRAKECATKFSHTRPDGSDYAKAFPASFLDGSFSVNENIGMGQPTPLRIAKSWYSSSGHRTTMLSTWYDRAGLAVYLADDGIFYWSLDVAGPSGYTGGEEPGE